MRKESNPNWKRMMTVQLYSCILSINMFADSIGLNDPEILYQIRAGHKNIDLDLALKIKIAYPIFRVRWLMMGKGSPYDETVDLK